MSNVESTLQAWKLPSWFLKALCALVVEVFLLIALGGSVRIMKAGLACPDWPLCFGDFIPDYHPQVYFEFLHRVMAGVVAISTVVLAGFLFVSKAPRSLKVLAGASLAILAGQIIFGGLTVILLLKAGVVATHLLLGTSFFITLLWIYLSVKEREPEVVQSTSWMRVFLIFLSIAFYGQILLGGLVASNFASLVCIDFPTCHGQWFPTWSGIIGIHMIHRYGGYTMFLLALVNFVVQRRWPVSERMKRLSGYLMLGVCGQVALGIANILLLTPPLIAVCHLALGVGLLSITFRQLHATREIVIAKAARTDSPAHSFRSNPAIS